MGGGGVDKVAEYGLILSRKASKRAKNAKCFHSEEKRAAYFRTTSQEMPDKQLAGIKC